MSDQHINSAYDRDLDAIQANILKMGGLVEAAIAHSITSLSARDVELAEEVRRTDKVIDALEEEINEAAALTIALRAPVSKDLRIILSVLRISNSLERIGDYAKNIAKRVPVLAEHRAITETDAALRRMSREVQAMLKDTLDAFVERDTERAMEIIRRDKDIDQMYNALFREFFTYMIEDPRNMTSCMHLHFVAKNIERMGDIITNIAEQIVYLTTGRRPEDPRPKGDLTTTFGASE